VESTHLNLEEVGRHAHTLGELVGLALRGVRNCPMALNLRPASVVKRHRLAEQRPYILLAGACVLLALAVWWLYFQRASKLTEDVAATVATKSQPLKNVESKMKAALADIKKQEDVAEPFAQAVRERDYWTTIIADINSRLPSEYIWITSFGIEETTGDSAPPPPPKGGSAQKAPVRLIIKGLYAENPRGAEMIDEFVKNLEDSPYFKVKKDEMQRTVPDQFTWGWPYSFPLVLEKPINLPKRTAQ
jgi:Tfp pilus assembly protein PilN